MEVFAVLAEPSRRRILDTLRGESHTVNGLVQSLGMSQPSVSKHLRTLRDAGLVSVRADGQRRWYDVDPGPLTDLAEWLEPYRQMWAGRLDLLETHLDNTSTTRSNP